MKRFHLIPLVAAAFLCLAAFSALDDATAASVVPRCDKSEVQMNRALLSVLPVPTNKCLHFFQFVFLKASKSIFKRIAISCAVKISLMASSTKRPRRSGVMKFYTLAHAINTGPTYATVNRVPFSLFRKPPRHGEANKNTENFTPTTNTIPQV